MANTITKDKQLTKNFNFFVLIRKELQKKKKRQGSKYNLKIQREKEKNSRERNSEIYFWKNNRMNVSDYSAYLFIDRLKVVQCHYQSDDVEKDNSRFIYL